MMEIGAVTLEIRVLTNADKNIKVAGASAFFSCIAGFRYPELMPGLDPGRYLDLNLVGFFNLAFPAAFRAGDLITWPVPPHSGHVVIWVKEPSIVCWTRLTWPVPLHVAFFGRSSRLCSGAFACRAGDEVGNIQFLCYSFCRFLKSYIEVIPEIVAAPRARSLAVSSAEKIRRGPQTGCRRLPRTSAETAPEKIAEIKTFESRASAELRGRVAELVVCRAFLLVGEI